MTQQGVKSSVDRPAPGRILMLLENCAYSADGRVRCEANSLAAAGYQVTVIGPKRRGDHWCETFGSVVAYQYPAPPDVNGALGYVFEYGYSLAAMALLSLWVLFRRGFDVIHAHNPPDVLVLIALAYRPFGKRFVFDHHDLSPDMYLARFATPGNPLIHRCLMYFERLSCRSADLVIATNESYKQVQIRRIGIPESRIAVVRNGPESWHLQTYSSVPGLRDDSRFLIGYVGVMGNQDGVDYLLRALQHLKHELHRDDWRCVLVGAGNALDELQSLAAKLGIAENLVFTGWLDYEKVPRYIASCDICVAPDPSTAYNNRSTVIKVMEYMAQSKPVVAFDLTETRVTAGDAALYAQPNDVQDFARQIAHLMDNPDLRAEIGRVGRLRITTNLSWEHQERRLLDAYRRLLTVEGRCPVAQRASTTYATAPPLTSEREICVTD